MSVRERMEQHRANPACTSCHKVIDPLGLALENFDPSGKWRIKDSGVPVDPTGVMYDGTKMSGPADLRQALMKHQDAILLSFTESLMTYALGRPSRVLRHADRARDGSRRGQERPSHVGVHFRCGEQRGLPNGEGRRRWRTAGGDRSHGIPGGFTTPFTGCDLVNFVANAVTEPASRLR